MKTETLLVKNSEKTFIFKVLNKLVLIQSIVLNSTNPHVEMIKTKKIIKNEF